MRQSYDSARGASLQISDGCQESDATRLLYLPAIQSFRDGPSSAPPELAVHNYMGYETFSVFSAAISLECTILLLGAALFLDYRRSLRRQWLLRHLESILRSDPEPELVDLADAA